MLLRKDFRKDAALAGIVMLCVVGLLLTVLPLDSEAHRLTEEQTITTTEVTIKYDWRWVVNEDGILEYKHVEVSRTTTTTTTIRTVEVEHKHLLEKIWDAITGSGSP